jgi:hypothetical protein
VGEYVLGIRKYDGTVTSLLISLISGYNSRFFAMNGVSI